MVECRDRGGTKKNIHEFICVCRCVYVCVQMKDLDRRTMIRLQFLLAVYPHYCCQGAYQLN